MFIIFLGWNCWPSHIGRTAILLMDVPVIETRLGAETVAEMPLAADATIEAGIGQHFRERGPLPQIGPAGNVVRGYPVEHPGLGRHHPRQQA